MRMRIPAGVISAVFIATMLFITFLSKEVRYFTVPKVITEVVRIAAGGFLIPDSAILPDGQSVYVIETRENLWGKEYYIRLRSVRTGREEHQLNAIQDINQDINQGINRYANQFSYQFMTVIEDGLHYGDVVVAGWDRDIMDGDRVEIFK